MTEIVGYISTFKNEIEEALKQKFFVEKGRFPSKLEMNFNDTYFNKFHGAFAMVLKDSSSMELPLFRIPAELHAILRWNKDRKYKDGNDMIDFFHASYALPYCDFFFTENELKSNICSLKFDKLYNCCTVSKEDEIIELLTKME